MDVIRDDIQKAIDKERRHAERQFGVVNSQHERYALLKEEFEEADNDLLAISMALDAFWDEVKIDSELADTRVADIRKCAEDLAIEACQIAAVCDKTIRKKIGGY